MKTHLRSRSKTSRITYPIINFFSYFFFFRRDGWQLFSSMQVWEQLVSQTKKASRDHAALADIYTTHITSRCSNINDDLQRMYRKCREIGYEIHEEVLKVLHELHTAMKTHHNYQSEFRQAESKLQVRL